MKSTRYLPGLLLLAVLLPLRIQAQNCPEPYATTWDHAHRHCCSEVCDYPWTKDLARAYHEKAVNAAPPCPDCMGTTCGTCKQELVAPKCRHDENRWMINELKCSYCASPSYIENLHRMNDRAYQQARMLPEGSCPHCNPPKGQGCCPTLDAVRDEILATGRKCSGHGDCRAGHPMH
jgi:hypothetical protein